MKKCHSCGTKRENNEKAFREFDNEYYCIFCLDQDGKPRNPNPVRKSIVSFWRDRDSDNQETKKLSS